MKKKILLVLLCMVSVLCLCFGLTACGDNDGGNSGGNSGATDSEQGGNTQKPDDGQGGGTTEHTHDLTPVAAKQADCTTEGNIAYFTCQCGKWFSDAEGTKEIKDKNSVTIPKSHKLTPVAAVKATCTTTGNIAYYVCSDCDNWFSDDKGKTQITDKDSVVTAKAAHYYVESVCEDCGKKQPTEGLVYTETSGGKCEVSGIGTAKGAVIVIDNEYNGKPVTSVGNKAFLNCLDIVKVVVPEGVTVINDYAFQSCRSLTSLSLPEGLTRIGNYALNDCQSMTNLLIPASVTSIGGAAFKGCVKLANVSIPSNVTSIGGEAFNECAITSVVIPEGVTAIGWNTFSNCVNLSNVTIPASVKSIDAYAFYSCPFTSITFKGTKAQWKAIRKTSKWDDGTGNYTVHCSDGNISK